MSLPLTLLRIEIHPPSFFLALRQNLDKNQNLDKQINFYFSKISPNKSHRILKKFPKNSPKIPRKSQKNFQNIPKILKVSNFLHQTERPKKPFWLIFF